MGKLFLIGWKDVKLAFRDRAGLIFMLLAPMLLTIGLGFVTGSFTTSSSSISGIPVVIVNLDKGQLGNALTDAIKSAALAELITPSESSSVEEARSMVTDDRAAAVVIIPAGFTDSVIPSATTGEVGPLKQIELYANPTRSTSVGVVKAILEGFLNQLEVGRISAETTVATLLSQGIIRPDQAVQVGQQIGMQQAVGSGSAPAINMDQSSTSGAAMKFNALAFMAPGMALMFLMFTVSNGGRALLYEKNHGTLPRLMVSPVTTSQVLGGKVLGVYFTGVLQMLILIGASAILFRLGWGNPLSVLLIVLAAVFGAVGWGSIVTALSNTTNQVSNIGSALMLSFGVLGGSFFSLENMPAWYKIVSRITPNSWGISAFSTLAAGGTLVDILPSILALSAMGAILFGISVMIIRHRGLFQN